MYIYIYICYICYVYIYISCTVYNGKVKFLVHMQKEESKVNIGGTA